MRAPTLAQHDRRSPALACSRGVSLHMMRDASVLFDQPTQRLFLLNATSTAMWCLIEEGAEQADLAGFLGCRGNVDPAEADRLVARTLADWRRRGLIDRRALPRPMTREAPRRSVPPGVGPGRLYRVGALTIRLELATQALDDVLRPVMAHLERGTGAADASLAVVGHAGGFRFLAGNEILADARTLEETPAVLRACLVRLTTRNVPHLLAIHAAALGRDDGCLLVPAHGGRGKTTLAAALCKAGWRYLSDDVTLVTVDGRAVPVPTPLAIKSGSGRLLQRLYPELADQPRGRLPNRRIVRHLSPPPDQVVSTPLPIRWLVFPVRVPERTAPTPLGTAAAIARLLEVCLSAPRLLTRSDVDALTTWMANVRSFVFPVADPGTVAATIERLTTPT